MRYINKGVNQLVFITSAERKYRHVYAMRLITTTTGPRTTRVHTTKEHALGKG